MGFIVRQQPCVDLVFAFRKDDQKDDRQSHDHRRRRDQRRVLEIVVEPVNDDCDDQSRQKHERVDQSPSLGQALRHDTEYRGRPTMHDGGTEAPHHPNAEIGARKLVEVVEIFREREAGPDCEAHDGCIDHESNAIAGKKDDDE